jgi:endonuclease-3
MAELQKVIARLRKRYGDPALPPARGPFELILWENACYLLPDDRRATVFEALRTRVGMDPYRILKANRGLLLELATMGGMQPEKRMLRWLEIARITVDRFGGTLDGILKEPYAKARKALKEFPSIGDPGAEKILAFCGIAGPLPLDSNGSRVLLRVGYGWENQRNYAAQYRSIQEAIASELPRRADALARAHLLLRQHGKEICRDQHPRCAECPAAEMCAFAARA